MQELLLILRQFGGGMGGEAGPQVVRFLLPSFFWLTLTFLAYQEWRRDNQRRDQFIFIAALIGLSRELLMFIAEYGSYRGLVQFDEMFHYYPPLEHLLTMISTSTIAFAFLWKGVTGSRFARNFLIAAIGISLSIYLFAAPGWHRYVEVHPGRPFGSYIGDILFRIAATLILGTALTALARKRLQGKRVSRLLLLGLGCFFLDELLMIFNLLQQERHVEIFAPIRHNLHIWAIPFLLGSYWVELNDRLRDTALRAQEELDARMKVKAILRASEERYRTLIENLPVGIALLENSCRITMVNRKMAEIFQRPEASLIGGFCYNLFSDCEQNCPYQEGSAQHSSPSVVRFETEGRRADDSPLKVELTIVPLYGEDGHRAGFIEMVEDVTEKKQAEAEKLALLDQLRHAEKMEAVGHLAGGIAHDFNNQLTGVLGYAEMLQYRLPEGKLKNYALQIRNSASHSAVLIEQLLAFSRKGKYHSDPIEINRLLEDVIGLLERSFDKRIQLKLIHHGDQAHILGDQGQLQNALLNVAFNARDAMPNGGTLTFEASVFDPPTGWEATRDLEDAAPNTRYLQLSISDTGCGIPPEVLPHIFEPFFTTKEPGKGTGMGLASTYGTLRNHKGHIDAESQPGAGTTIRLYLPLAEAELPAEQPAACALTRGQARILLIDDEQVVREATREMLEMLGYQVKTCADGREAVEVYRREWRKIDLVILDMIMPVMDGWETFLALQRINPGLRVILCSGYSLDKRARNLLDEGHAGFVQKPFSVETLSAQVSESLRPGSVGAPS